ncbi:hypothetical protein ALC57_16137 [Trachymyrmex cornetzi]|uniref:Uncharacterized protein n=1 Tax=Trachymyrmex cornetzi TaxID=471704 RepID=A0A151IVG8_9HYME|nr:hypothetical protein ALC57_16137 [Trachymyrmex cornetzi]
MTQVSSCGAAQCAIIKGVLFCLMDLSKFQYLENEYLEGSRALVEPQSAATSRVDLEVSQTEWKKCFDKWFERMQKCIDYKGEYFEKQ